MEHHRESTEARLPEAFWCAAAEFADTLENDESTGDMRTGRGPSLSEPWPVNLGSGRLILQIVILPFCRPYGEAHMAQQGSAISSIFPAHETERPPPGLSGSTQSRRTRVGGQHPSGGKRRPGTVQKPSGRLGIRQEPPGRLAGQSQPAEGLAWQHRGVCRCACEPPIPRVLIKPLAPTSAAVVSAGSCRPLQCEDSITGQHRASSDTAAFR